MMNHIVRFASKLSPISSFGIKSRLPIFTSNPFLVLSSYFHASNCRYGFEEIKNIDDAVSTFNQMVKMNPMPSILHYNQLFCIILKMDHDSQVINMFNELSLLGVPFDPYTMNILVNCYCSLKQVDLSYSIIGYFLKRGFAPDIVTFTSLMKGYFWEDNVDEAVCLFKRMIRFEMCEVNEVAISTVLDGLVKAGLVVNAVELLEIAERKNWKLDVFCYTTVIDGLCKFRMLEDAMNLVFRMVNRDVFPNIVTYTALIYSFCNHDRFEIARDMFNDLPSKGIYPDVIAYNVMIQGLCREGLFKDAKVMLEQMERLGCVPDSVTYNIILQGCLHRRHIAHSMDFVRHIVGREFELGASTFFLLLSQIRGLRQEMHGIYDDSVINHLMLKLVSSDAIHEIRTVNSHVLIQSLIQKLC